MNHVLFSGMIDGIVMDRIVRDYEFTMPTKHFHSEYELYYLLEGTRYYFIENETYLVKKGSLVLINRLQIHKTGSTGNSYHDRILIELDGEPFSALFSAVCQTSMHDFFSLHFGVLDLDEQGQHFVEPLLLSILDEMQNKSYQYESVIMLKLLELFIYILRYKTEQNKLPSAITANTAKHKKVHEVANYIVSNYHNVESLDELSKMFYVSKCYLSRIFKEVTGFTVHEYINIHRIKQAQHLLTHSEYNISEIADALGYDSLTYFERVFKKYTETSPMKYRKKSLLIGQKARERKYEKGLKVPQ